MLLALFTITPQIYSSNQRDIEINRQMLFQGLDIAYRLHREQISDTTSAIQFDINFEPYLHASKAEYDQTHPETARIPRTIAYNRKTKMAYIIIAQKPNQS